MLSTVLMPDQIGKIIGRQMYACTCQNEMIVPYFVLISKLKCYYKQNGETRYGCGFTDKSLIDDDETEIKTVNVDDTTVFYVSKKHHDD